EDRLGALRKPGGALVLLAAAALSRAVRPRLVDRAPRLFGAVFVSYEHGKAPPLAIVYLVIAIHLFFKRKYWPLLPLGLVFTWTYDLFVLLIMATVFWSVTIAISEKRFEWRPLVYVIVGCALGLVINPYFPHNLQLLVEHMKIKLTASDFDTKVGSEWYPYDSWEFLGNSAVACIAMLVGYLAFEPSERRRGQYPIFFLLVSTALMIMTA